MMDLSQQQSEVGRFSFASPFGSRFALIAPVLPLVSLTIWYGVGTSEGRTMPLSVVWLSLIVCMPGVVLCFRRYLQPRGSLLSTSVAVFIVHFYALAIGAAATWYFDPPDSYFRVYEAAIPYFAIHVALMCGVRIVGMYVVREKPPATIPSLSNVPMFLLALPQVGYFAIVAYFIAVGAFFHSAAGDFQFESPLYGPLTMLRNGLILLLPVWGREVFLQNKLSWKWIYIGTWIVVVLLATLSGSRGSILSMVGLGALGPLLSGRIRVRVWHSMVGVGIIVALATFATFYRDALRAETGGGAVTDIGEVESAGKEGRRAVESSENPVIPLLLRFDDYRPFAVVHAYYLASEGHFLDGDTFLMLLQDPVPRIIWPDKPQVPVVLSTIMARLLQEGGASPLTIPGEFYANFGDEGAYIGGIITGIMWVLLDLLFDRRQKDPLVLALVALMPPAFGLFDQSLTGVIGAIYKMGGVALVYRALLSWFFGATRWPARREASVAG